MIIIKVKTGNATFYDEDGTRNANPEVAKILREAADRIEREEQPGRIFDTNGNKVCTIAYTGADRGPTWKGWSNE